MSHTEHICCVYYSVCVAFSLSLSVDLSNNETAERKYLLHLYETQTHINKLNNSKQTEIFFDELNSVVFFFFLLCVVNGRFGGGSRARRIQKKNGFFLFLVLFQVIEFVMNV